MDLEAIQNCIPHRAPMLLVDQVLEKSESSILTEKTFRDDEFFTQGHYPGNPIVPGIILCEFGMQSGAILLSQFAGDGVPVATRMNNVRFRNLVRPGETIRAEVDLVEKLSNAFFMNAKLSREGKPVMRFEFACAAVEEEKR